MTRRHYFVTGRVQGVGFRAFVTLQATQIGIKGWVRNCSDGRVEVVAEGDTEAQLRLHEALEKGPMWSRVSSVVSDDTNIGTDPLIEFSILPTV